MEFLVLSLLALFLNPMVLIILLVFFTTLVCFMMAWVLGSFFYSYLVFMLFISGILIMFMYLCGIILMEKFDLGYANYLGFFLVLGGFMVSWSVGILTVPMKIDGLVEYVEFVSIEKFLDYPYSFFTLMFIIYMFMCLLIVYEIVKSCDGPLRAKI